MSEEKIEKGEQTPILDENIYNQHNWFVVSLILVSFWLFVCLIGFNGLLFTPFYANDIFNWTNNDAMDITPAPWTWAIWGLIYICQFIWLCYGLFSLFRKTTNGSYLYLKPDFMCWGIYLTICITYLANIGWCWCFSWISWSLLFNIIMTWSTYVFLFISCRKLYENQSELTQFGCKKDIWFVRIFVQNGCAIYATWTSIWAICNFGHFLVLKANVDAVEASTFSLLVILFATVNYFIFENFIWRDYLRYMYTPYFVVLWWMIGSLTANLVSGEFTRNNMLTMIILVIIACLLIARIVLNFFYKTKYPEGFNFNKLIKVNKIFKSTRNGSEPVSEQQGEQA